MAYSIEVYPTQNIWNGSGTRYGRDVRFVALHGTRSGRSGFGPEQEYSATVHWFKNPDSNASTEYVVGPGKVAVFVSQAQHNMLLHSANSGTLKGDNLLLAAAKYGHWHLGIGANDVSLSSVGIEVPQSFKGDRLDTHVYQTLVELCKDLVRLFPKIAVMEVPKPVVAVQKATGGFFEHLTVNETKSDIGPPYDLTRFLHDVNASVPTGSDDRVQLKEAFVLVDKALSKSIATQSDLWDARAKIEGLLQQ